MIEDPTTSTSDSAAIRNIHLAVDTIHRNTVLWHDSKRGYKEAGDRALEAVDEARRQLDAMRERLLAEIEKEEGRDQVVTGGESHA